MALQKVNEISNFDKIPALQAVISSTITVVLS